MLPGFEPSLLTLARAAAIGDEQLHLLQLILRAVDENSPITHEVAPLNSVLAGITRAIIVLDGHLVGGQPYPVLVRDVCSGALRAVTATRRARGSRQVLRTAEDALRTVVALPNGNSFRAGCVTPAAELAPLRCALEQMVRDDIIAVWDGSRRVVPDIRYVARETAFLLLATRRHGDGIRRSIERFLRRADRPGDELLAALMPPTRRHRVGSVVDGTDKLKFLQELRPDATQFRLGDQVSGWGLANKAFDAFAQSMREARPGGPHPLPGCVISLVVEAVDPEAAAAVGHREVSELLDHYVSGHRLVDLTLRSDVLVNDIERRSAQWRSTAGRGVDEAFPLSQAWPPGLGEAMRMAHIARTTDAPMAAAALSWFSVEAAGLTAEPLAGALALQMLRHGLAQSSSEVLSGIRASTKARRVDSDVETGQANRLRQVLENFNGPEAARADVIARLTSADARATIAREEFARHQAAASDYLSRIQEHVVWSDREHVQDLNAWVDLLRPERAIDSVAVRNARAALTNLLDELSPAAAELVRLWRARFARPSTCARWLDDMKDAHFAELRWLYATRNLTIHTGRLTLAGDVQLALVASGLADLTLEFLGCWYATAAKRDPPALSDTPAEIVDTLNRRHTDVKDHLRARHALSRLHAEHLTSCTSTGWDR